MSGDLLPPLEEKTPEEGMKNPLHAN